MRRLRPLHGFTLIELLLVLTITAAVLTVAAPAFYRALDGIRLRDTTLQVSAALRTARARAIDERSTVHFVADRDTGFGMAGTEPRIPPAGVKVTVSPAQQGIRFLADGTSSGGKVMIDDGNHSYRIEVAPITGQIGEPREELP